MMGINTPHPLPFVTAGSPHEKHISIALLSPPIYAFCFYPLSIFKSTPTSNGEGMGRK
jgi:hypothetical protein